MSRASSPHLGRSAQSPTAQHPRRPRRDIDPSHDSRDRIAHHLPDHHTPGTPWHARRSPVNEKRSPSHRATHTPAFVVERSHICSIRDEQQTSGATAQAKPSAVDPTDRPMTAADELKERHSAIDARLLPQAKRG